MFTFLKSTQKDKFFDTYIDLIHDKTFPCLYSELFDHFDPFILISASSASKFRKTYLAKQS
jgi:hypothetical protein